MPPSKLKSLKIYNCSNVNIEKFHAKPKENLETSHNIFKIDKNDAKRPGKHLKIKNELSSYRNELREFNNSTKELEEKYLQINSELNEMQQKHNYIIKKKAGTDFDSCSYSSSTGNDYTLQQKSTQVFQPSNSFIKILSNEPLKKIKKIKLPNNRERNISFADEQWRRENKENTAPIYISSSSDKTSEIEYMPRRSVYNTQSMSESNTADISSLKKTITKLQNDSERFCSIIEKQKSTLSDYRSRFAKAQHLFKEQHIEIEQLNSKNLQLEKDTSLILDELHHKISSKLQDVDLQTNRMKAEQLKKESFIRENCVLNERVKAIEAEAKQLKIKLEEMSHRKMSTISRLKVAERDLKIFKNYNAALKQEKRKLNEELRTLNEQIDNMQDVSKRTMCRHREQNEKQRRQMQKRIFELEMKLNRSQNSTTSLIQERDTLIAELQSQLNNLVHNFEVSQKHIRVLRQHIYSMSDNNNNRQPLIHDRLLP